MMLQEKINKLFLNLRVRYIVYAFLGFQLLSIIGDVWPAVSSLVFIILVLFTAYVSFKNIEFGFLILIFEFLTGHGGYLFEFMGLSIRLALFILVMIIWLFKEIKNRDFDFSQFKSPALIIYCLFLIFVAIAFFNGLLLDNGILALKDLINYSFLFLAIPLIKLVKRDDFLNKLFLIIVAGTIGIVIETFLVFLVFAFNLAQVHDVFYWWWRDVVIGKATFTKNNFFRIVTPAHVFILPIFITYLSLSFSSFKKVIKERKSFLFLSLISSFCLLLNFSRAYFLGIIAGLIVLKTQVNFKKWFIFSVLIILIMVAQFSILFGIANGGDILSGSGFFKDRMGTLTRPQDELSSLTRLVILPDLASDIYKRPIFGNGLGSKVGYPDPLSGDYKLTYHIDWGYLEIWLETGFLGLMTYLSLLFFIFYKAIKKSKQAKNYFNKRLYIGLSAGLLALFVASLGGPFLFHPLGILYIVFSLALILR